MILDKFFLKYERGVKLKHPQKKTTLKKPSLIRVKVEFLPSNQVVFTCLNEIPIKMITNDFYFVLKTFFVLEMFTFLSLLFGYERKRLDNKVKVKFKFYDVTD